MSRVGIGLQHWQRPPRLLEAQSDKSQGDLGDRVPRITTAREAVIVCLDLNQPQPPPAHIDASSATPPARAASAVVRIGR